MIKANVPARVADWYPGEQGGNAIADVLFGDYNPAGRLPLTWYQSTSDLPAFDDYEVFNKKTFSKTLVFKSGPWVNEFNEYVKSLNHTDKKLPVAKDTVKEEKIYEEISF